MPEPKVDYITKSEAAAIYRRSERSLSRDITNAIKFRDDVVLQSVELQLEDGTRRAGSDLSIEEIVDLRDKGLNPTWLLQQKWLQATYGRRDEPFRQEAQVPRMEPTSGSSTATNLPLPDEPLQRVAVLMTQNEALKQTNADLRVQAERLEKELDRRAEERREENELQKQNNVLMQQVYNLLSKWQEFPGQISVLPAPRSSAPSQDEAPANIDESTIDVRKGTTRAMRATSKDLSRRPNKRARPTKSDTQSNQKRPATTVSKYLPTIDRAVRSFFRK